MGRYGVHTRARHPEENGELPGIVIRGADDGPPPPRISAFVYGRRREPAPTLPFGRWKEVA
ncbi:MAG TPA: hypothetical protein VJ925_11530 [Longimicrobiales bacterium]|nr:hypothetical protein [Longimicrobiales bacterium]